MIITDTYRKNADNFKRIVGNYFGYSTEDFNRMSTYVDDPTLILNENAKKLFEKYGDEVVDFRVPLDSKKIIGSEIPDEIYIIKFMLNDILFENYPKYRETENDCKLYDDMMMKNKFMLFGQERKIWRFLHSHAEIMATKLLENHKIVKFDTKYTEYKLGAVFNSLYDYMITLNEKNTLLASKIQNLQIDYMNGTSDLKEVTKMIQTIIRIIADIINAKSVNNKSNYRAYLSFNYFDWFFASTGEDWDSCLGFASETFYGIGLPNLISNPDWGMLEIVKNNQSKEEFGITVPRLVTRAWAIYGENDKYNLVKSYPVPTDELKEKVFCDGLVIFSEISNSSSSVFSKNCFYPFVMKDGYSVPFIYADSFGLESYDKAVRVYISDIKYGIMDLRKKGDKYGNGGDFNDMCRSMESIFDSIFDMVDSGSLSFYDAYENSESIICDCCGERDEDCYYLDGFGYVCQHCIDNDGAFYYCDDCEQLMYENDTSYEIVNGDRICEHCLSNHYISCDDCGKYVLLENTTNVGGLYYCEDCLEENIDNGNIIECKTCGKLTESAENGLCFSCYLKEKKNEKSAL